MGANYIHSNYNASNFSEKGPLRGENDNALSEMTKGGRCNDCAYFSFGGYKCKKTDENGNLIRPKTNPVVYTEPTSKGRFIHVIKPYDCKDFKRKKKEKGETKKQAGGKAE